MDEIKKELIKRFNKGAENKI